MKVTVSVKYLFFMQRKILKSEWGIQEARKESSHF